MDASADGPSAPVAFPPSTNAGRVHNMAGRVQAYPGDVSATKSTKQW